MGDDTRGTVESRSCYATLALLASTALALLLCLSCASETDEVSDDDDADDTDTGDNQPADIDLTVYLEDMERLCAGVFMGTIEDAAGENSSVTYLPCEHDGESYQLEVEVVSEMSCSSSEDEAGVDCTFAASGSIELEGLLEIGTATEREVVGSAFVTNSPCIGGLWLECDFELTDEDVPHHNFTVLPDTFGPDEEDLERFDWSRRHSAENEDPPVWEVCGLPIASHE